MEIILAIVVAAAVIFFGALISMGNERQRKAIDDLREQTVLWAMQDLRIKRERLARDVRVDDPLGWLNRIVAKVYGCDPKLQVIEAFDEPQALICGTGEGGGKVVFSTLSPREIQRIRRRKRSQLSQYTDRNLLLSMSLESITYELTALNSGILFDLELPLAWNGLTGQKVEKMERMWIYMVS